MKKIQGRCKLYIFNLMAILDKQRHKDVKNKILYHAHSLISQVGLGIVNFNCVIERYYTAYKIFYYQTEKLG